MKRPRFVLPSLALFAGLLALPAQGAPAEIGEILERPIARFILLHTSQGAALSRQIMGWRIETDADLSRMARKLSQEKLPASHEELLEKLENAENEIRSDLAVSGPSPDYLVQVERKAGELLFAGEGPGGSLDENRLQFLEQEDDRSFAGHDLSDTDLEGTPLAGADLRLTRWKDTLLTDLSASDLRGADLRGAVIGEETHLEGAVYDQFTALPFGRAEAVTRGMKYSPSTLPEGFAAIDARMEAAAARKGLRKTPPDGKRISTRVLRELPARDPRSSRAIEFFSRPKFVNTPGNSYVRFEAGRLRPGAAANPFFNRLVAEVASYEGEVRWLVLANSANGDVLTHEMAYFRLDGKIPVIALSANADAPTVAHELEHLRDWVKIRREYLAQGYDETQASRLTNRKWGTPRARVLTERNAIREQLKAQAKIDDAAGLPLAERQARFERRGFVFITSYPELEGLELIYHSRTPEEVLASPALRLEAESYCRKVIRNVLIARRLRFNRLGMTGAAKFTGDQLFYEAVGSNAKQYAASGVLGAIKDLFTSLIASEAAKLPDDAFRRAVAERN